MSDLFSMADANRVHEAVREFVKLNSDATISRLEKEEAFDHVLKLLGWKEPRIQPLRLKSGSGSPSSHLLDLPAELNLQIVSYLDWPNITSLRLVSRYWRDIVTPPTVDLETSLLNHKIRCQELNRLIELRLNALFYAPNAPWSSRQYLMDIPPGWRWRFRYPCYTCMRWLRGHHYFDIYNFASFTFLKRYLLLSNRWPESMRGYPPQDTCLYASQFARPGLRLSYTRGETAGFRRYDPVFPYLSKARMCIHCAASKRFLPPGQMMGASSRSPAWIICICKKVFWRPNPDGWKFPVIGGRSKRHRPWFELMEYRPITLTAASDWGSFWWCEECNAAGMSKENWLQWAHELRIGATEAHIERLEGHKIAKGESVGRKAKKWCPIMKEQRYCRCAQWFVQEVWDGLTWPEPEDIDLECEVERKERGIHWVKYECSKALGKRSVSLRQT